jgi:hypothetical protein
MAEEAPRHPSIVRLKRVALALGPLLERVVFIGGAIAPLLQTDPPFEEARPTKDVDGMIASTKYAEIGPLHDALRDQGFTQVLGETPHLHRWTSPDGDWFDLVPSGAHSGGSGQEWDRIALESSVAAELGDGVTVRHASGPAFLGLKWAAYLDRGIGDPFASHDLEDILALVASRATVVDELTVCSGRLREFVVARTAELLDDPRLPDLLAGHLNSAEDPAATTRLVLRRLEAVRALAP